MNIGVSIRKAQARKTLDGESISFSELAERLEVSQSTISNLVNSEYCHGLMLKKLSGIFGLKASEFIALGE